MSPHPERALFESWISGSLARPDQDAFEAHLHGCQSCTARLQEEARFEADLDEVAQAWGEREQGGLALSPLGSDLPPEALPTPANRPHRSWGRGLKAGLMASFALAAAALLFVLPGGSSLPDYGDLALQGQAAQRAVAEASTWTTVGGSYTLTLRARSDAAAEVQAQVLHAEGGLAQVLDARVELSANGSVRARGQVEAGGPLARIGQHDLILAVGPQGAHLDEGGLQAAGAGAAHYGDWSFFRTELTVKPTTP
jgi:hypothetical protein